MNVDQPRTEALAQLTAAVEGCDTETRARFAKLPETDRDVYVGWIAAAPDQAWLAWRADNAARNLRTTPDPHYWLVFSVLDELRERLGRPVLLGALAPDEQVQAISEQRVLELFHTRNYDEATVSFDVVAAGAAPRPGVMVAYPRPARLEPSDAFFLDRNPWDTLPDALDSLVRVPVHGADVTDPTWSAPTLRSSTRRSDT